MSWLTVTEYLWHIWPRICFAYHNHNTVLSSFMTYHRVCSMRNAKGATSRPGTAYPFGAQELTPGFQWAFRCACRPIICLTVFCSMVCCAYTVLSSCLLPLVL
jgi:hypothetical protein